MTAFGAPRLCRKDLIFDGGTKSESIGSAIGHAHDRGRPDRRHSNAPRGGRRGTGGPFPTGDLSPADAVAASEVNKLRQNPKGRTQLRTTTDAVVKIQRNGNRVTGTIADSLGSIDFTGDYVDVPGKASVRIANMRMTPSIGTLVNPPTTLTISRNVNQRLVFEFDKDVSVRVFPFTRTQYRGRQAYQPNPPVGGGR